MNVIFRSKYLLSFTKSSLFVLTIIIFTLFISCKKEYSCENCQACIIDTSINIKDTAWRFNVGSKLYYGDLQFSSFVYDKHGISFYGYSLNSPEAIFGLGFRIDPLDFNQSINNLSINDLTINYGSNGTTTQKIEGFNYKPQSLKGVIKTFNTSNNIVEGYFCGTVLDDNGNDVNIANGRFRIIVN